MSLQDALMRDIIEHPDDDTPRLVYADLLEDQGRECDAVCAELIRVQCRLAKMPLDDPDRPDLELRELELLPRHPRRWAKPVRRFIKVWTLGRGFVDRVRLPRFQGAGDLDQLFQVIPLQHIEFPRGSSPVISTLNQELAALPQLSRVRSLSFKGWRSDVVAASLLSCQHLTGLRHLSFDETAIAQTALPEIFSPRIVEPLQELTLRFRGTPLLYLRNLAQQGSLSNLRRLRFNLAQTTPIRPGTFGHFLKPLAPQLELLELTHGHLSTALEELTKWELPALRELALRDIGGNPAHGNRSTGFADLLKMPFVKNLTCLDLGTFPIGPSALMSLAAADLPSLRSLKLCLTEVRPDTLTDLASAKFADQLHVLDVSAMAVQFAPRYPAENAFAGLGVLRLRSCGLTVNTIAPLFASANLQNLRILDLTGNPFGDGIAEQLKRVRHWSKLVELRLQRTCLFTKAKGELRILFGEKVRYN